MGKLFGTDGVRGIANKDLTPELAFQLGQAGATVLAQGKSRPRVVIGKDTRISGSMLEGALVAGITSVGADVVLVGVVPTPAVAYLTQVMEGDAGIMISASHNPVEDNGLKFFSHAGMKLPDAIEDEIERLLDSPTIARPIGAQLGRVFDEAAAKNLYIDHLLSTVDYKLDGVHIALDCANGATFEVAPRIFTALGARVSIINHEPNGININANCGSTHIEVLRDYLVSTGAQMGFSYDGDGDRVLAVDDQGQVVNGDHILAICGLRLLKEGQLPHNKIVATIYSNGGLRQMMKQAGGQTLLTQAGDRYVLEAMLEQGLSLGGEQSGHIIFLDHTTTGDGILTSLQLLKVVLAEQKPLSKLAGSMPVFPQILTNVSVRSKTGWEQNPSVQQAIKNAENLLGMEGRIFVRASGTEPLIRVMGEHEDGLLLKKAVDLVVKVIQAEI